jgi:hypothetical protein
VASSGLRLTGTCPCITRRALSYRFQLEEGVTFGLFRSSWRRLAATYVRVHEVVAGLLASGEAVLYSRG